MKDEDDFCETCNAPPEAQDLNWIEGTEKDGKCPACGADVE